MVNQTSILDKVREFQKICWDIDRQSVAYKKDMANWESIYVSRKISIWITYCLRNSRISPNQVTALWLILGLLGAFLLIPHVYWMSILAIFLLYIAWILDNVDGELARYKKEFSIAGNLLDMIGHEIIFPVVCGCLTFSMILRSESNFAIFFGLMATALVTPLAKMQENVKLLLCIKTMSLGNNFEDLQKPIEPADNDEDEEKRLKGFVFKILAIIFGQTGMIYLLFPAVILEVENIYLIFYGLGLLLMLIPKYLARAKELTKISEQPYLLKRLFRPEWMDL